MTRRATVPTFRSLQVRNFRLFFTGQLVSQVGNWLTLVAQTLLVLHLTDSGVALGLLAAAQFGPVLVVGPFAGVVADRSDKRVLLMVVQSVAMAQSFGLAALTTTARPPLGAVYALALLGGLAVAFDNPARRSFVAELVPESAVGNAVSLNSALMTGARVAGPALAGLLVSTVGFSWCFLVDALTYPAVLVALARIDRAQLRRAPVTPRGRGQVRDGLRYVAGVPDLWVPLVMMAAIGTLAFNFQTVLPLFVLRDLGGSEVTFTWLLSIVSLGSLVGALFSARREVVGLGSVGGAAIAFGASMAVLAAVPNQPLAFAVGLLLGGTSIAFMTTSTTLVQVRAEPTMRGRVLALQSMLFLGSTPIGAPLVGAVAEHLGARYGLALGAAATLGAGVFGATSARRRSLPEEHPAAPAAAVGDPALGAGLER